MTKIRPFSKALHSGLISGAIPIIGGVAVGSVLGGIPGATIGGSAGVIVSPVTAGAGALGSTLKSYLNWRKSFKQEHGYGPEMAASKKVYNSTKNTMNTLKSKFMKKASIYNELRNSAGNTGYMPNTLNGFKNWGERNKKSLIAGGAVAGGVGLGAALYKKLKKKKED